MRKLVVIFVVCGLACISCGDGGKGKVLAKVGRMKITEGDLDLLARVNPRLKGRMLTKTGKKQVLENYVEQSLMYQEALDRNLDSDPLLKEKIKLYEKVILAQGLVEEKLDEASKSYYENNRDEFEKVKAAHIYIPFKTEAKNPVLSKATKVTATEQKAKSDLEKVIAELKKAPEKFAELAGKHSADSRTSKNGGDLGWITISDSRLKRWGWNLVAEQAFALQEGSISDPIKSENGWHVIKVLAGKKLDPLEEVKTQIGFKIQNNLKMDLTRELKEKYPVTYAEAEVEKERPEERAEIEGAKVEGAPSAEPAPTTAPAAAPAEPKEEPTKGK